MARAAHGCDHRPGQLGLFVHHEVGLPRRCLGHEFGRARDWYAKAMAQLPAEDRNAQRTGLVMAAIYRTLLDEIARDGYRVLDRKTSLTPIRKLWIAWKTARKLR